VYILFQQDVEIVSRYNPECILTQSPEKSFYRVAPNAAARSERPNVPATPS